jgi:hypothetical protein
MVGGGIALAAGLLTGALLALLFPRGSFLSGWLAGSALLVPGIGGLLAAWKWAGAGRMLGWMVALAFLLRLGLGVAVSLGLPLFGYEEPEQNAGYVFYDAFRRDGQAWELAQSGQPLLSAFTEDFATDQYGGLLALSALIYRGLSPDAHRPYLIIILGALAAGAGLPFFYRAVKERWNVGVAAAAGWIMALYPDSLLLGASQMREPYLIGLTGVAFWGVVSWPKNHRRAGSVIAASLLLIALFSSKIALPVAGVLAVWFFLDHLYEKLPRAGRIGVWVTFAAAGGLVAVLFWEWFAAALFWDIRQIQSTSGLGEKAVAEIGEVFRPVFYTIYGLARPLLPAAIAATRPPWIWKIIDVTRGVGWYALAPLLLYSFWTVFKARPLAARRALLWFAAAVLAWLVISSARAGGDQWDNPRYRVIFLPWMALLAGWGLRWAVEQHDAWLWRWLVVEAIFLGFFTQWYLTRYYPALGWVKMPFWRYPAWILALSAVVLGGGWLWDRLRRRRLSKL